MASSSSSVVHNTENTKVKDHTPPPPPIKEKEMATRPTSPATPAIAYDLGSSRPSSRAAPSAKAGSRPNSPAKRPIVYDLGSSRPSSRAASPLKTPCSSRPGSRSKKDAVKETVLEVGENGFFFSAMLPKTKIDSRVKVEGGGGVKDGNVPANSMACEGNTEVTASEGAAKEEVVKEGKRPANVSAAAKKLTKSPTRTKTKSPEKIMASGSMRLKSTCPTKNRDPSTKTPPSLSKSKYVTTPSSERPWFKSSRKETPIIPPPGATTRSSELPKRTPDTSNRETPKLRVTPEDYRRSSKGLYPSGLFSPQARMGASKGARDIGQMIAGVKAMALSNQAQGALHDQPERGGSERVKLRMSTGGEDAVPAKQRQTGLASSNSKEQPLTSPNRKLRDSVGALSHGKCSKGTPPSLRSAIASEMDSLRQDPRQSLGRPYSDSPIPTTPSNPAEKTPQLNSSTTTPTPSTPSLGIGSANVSENTPPCKPSTNPRTRVTTTIKRTHQTPPTTQKANSIPRRSPAAHPPPSHRPKHAPSNPGLPHTMRQAFYDRLSTPKRSPLTDRRVYHPRSPYSTNPSSTLDPDAELEYDFSTDPRPYHEKVVVPPKNSPQARLQKRL